MKIKDVIKSLQELPNQDADAKVWHEDMGLVEIDFVAENVTQDKTDKDNDAAVIYMKF